MTNSTIHIGAVIIHDSIDSSKNATEKSPIFYRYMLTLSEPQLIVCIVIACLGVLIFLFTIVNLMIFSYSHQQSQRDLLTNLTNIATELEGITAKTGLLNTVPAVPVRRRRPASFAALPSYTIEKPKLFNRGYRRYSCKSLEGILSESMVTIPEV